ncbi:hypothetical protein LEP1GSC005_1517 [Leptospira santarosai str. ST188]|nr:hypothetical protein LEP1GSC005_1517 [Leptospira santarosai str. ST188]EMO71953.1 hypothetical protein LEP1GSC130_0619 [Leptospira santarosai str. 200403458]EMO98902.1 hypothetical protein LEP1GSC120_1532 [Leptospira santarosai str. 200702252]
MGRHSLNSENVGVLKTFLKTDSHLIAGILYRMDSGTKDAVFFTISFSYFILKCDF